MDERYRVWKKNAPYLYDLVATHPLTWPSLSVQFFPDLEKGQAATQRLLLGTFTLGQGVDSFSVLQFSRSPSPGPESWTFNAGLGEFEVPTPRARLRPVQTVNHHGDVNKARYMPQNPDIIATGNNAGQVAVYNRSRHASLYKPEAQDVPEPQMRMASTTAADVFALDWNRQREGLLAAGTADLLLVYDILAFALAAEPIAAVRTPAARGVNDVEWVPTHRDLLVLGEESGWAVHDLRTSERTGTSDGAVNSVSVNPLNGSCVATGHASGDVKIWDTRTRSVVTQWRPHTQAVTCVRWHPLLRPVLATALLDCLVRLHCADGRLLFSHEGHMYGVNDVDWSLHSEWLLASVSDDNALHLWEPAEKFQVDVGN